MPENESPANELPEKTSSDSGSIVSTVLRAVALAMGVAVVVLNIMNAAETDTYITLLGIGLFSLALDALGGGKA